VLNAITFNQVAIAFTGLVALLLLTFGGKTARLVAPVFGLAGQPFWLLSAIESNQLGVLVVTLAYTMVWLGSALRSILTLRRQLVQPSRSAWFNE